jgi:lectin, mannose-binding 1
MLEDVFAATVQSQQDQFADLHNRIQIINHRVNTMYDLLEKFVRDQDERYNHIMGRMVPMHDQVSAVQRNVEKVERTTMETLRDLESKDFKDMLKQVHESIERSHNALGTSMPLAMATSEQHFPP